MKRQTQLAVACLSVITLGACAEDPPTTARDSSDSLEARQQALERKSPQRVNMAPVQATGEVPEAILTLLRKDLKARGVEDADPVLAEARVWPDGAMGCPTPGQMYTQALIEGYRVVFENASDRWDYRVSSNGGFILCERNVTLQQPGKNPAR